MDNGNICHEEKCTGCALCRNVCPKKCIRMEYNDEGFLVPYIDKNMCINCNMCKKKCPMNEMNRLMDNKKKESYEKEFCNVPLDELDGAMRVLHPIIDGIHNKVFHYGVFLKDYRKSAW